MHSGGEALPINAAFAARNEKGQNDGNNVYSGSGLSIRIGPRDPVQLSHSAAPLCA